MNTFVLTGNYLPEEVDGTQYVSLLCLIEGDVRFSRTGSPQDDDSGMRLLEQIRHLNTFYSLKDTQRIEADIVWNNVLMVRFRAKEIYPRDIVVHLYDIIHDYCLIEEALLTTRPLETLQSLTEQTRSLLLELRTLRSENKPHVRRLEYLVTSIRYGSLDIFGGGIPPAPKNFTRATLLVWLKPIRGCISETRKLH